MAATIDEEDDYVPDFHNEDYELIHLLSPLHVEGSKHAFSAPQSFSHASQPLTSHLICPRGELHTPEMVCSSVAGNNKLVDWGNFFCSPFCSPLHPSSTPSLSPGFIEVCAPLLKITPKFQLKRPEGRLVTPPTVAAMPKYVGSPLLPSWAVTASVSKSFDPKDAEAHVSAFKERRSPQTSSPIKILPLPPPSVTAQHQPLPPNQPAPPPSSRPMSRFFRQARQPPKLQKKEESRNLVSEDLHDSRSQVDHPSTTLNPHKASFVDFPQAKSQHQTTMSSWALPKLPPLKDLIHASAEEPGMANGTGRFSFGTAAAPLAMDVTARLFVSSAATLDSNQESAGNSDPSYLTADLTLRPTTSTRSYKEPPLASSRGLRPTTSLNASKTLATRQEPICPSKPNSTLTLCPKVNNMPARSILSPLNDRDNKSNSKSRSKGKESSLVKTLAGTAAGPPVFCVVNSLVKKLPAPRFSEVSNPREISPTAQKLFSGRSASGLQLPQIDKNLLAGSTRVAEGKENQATTSTLLKPTSKATAGPSLQLLGSILASGPDSDFSFAPPPPPQPGQRTARILLGSFDSHSAKRIR